MSFRDCELTVSTRIEEKEENVFWDIKTTSFFFFQKLGTKYNGCYRLVCDSLLGDDSRTNLLPCLISWDPLPLHLASGRGW